MFNFLKKKENNVSPMTGEHLFEVAGIHKASFTHFWNDGAIAEMLKQPGMNGLVLQSKGKIQAFIIYRTVAKESEIITIATTPKKRRSGSARNLMHAFIRNCLSDRLDEIFLEVDEANIAATKLYRSLGFKKVGDRKGYYNRGAINDGNAKSDGNAWIMRLDLKA